MSYVCAQHVEYDIGSIQFHPSMDGMGYMHCQAVSQIEKHLKYVGI